MPSAYSELCSLETFKEGVKKEFIESCEYFLKQNKLQVDAQSTEVDKSLWERSQRELEAIEPLLCLRCRVSHPIQKEVTRLFLKFRSNLELREELNLYQMMICVLDDQGEKFLRVRKDQSGGSTTYITKKFNWSNLSLIPKNEIKPFGAEVIYSFNPSLSKIDTWTAHLVKSNALLKSYFVNCGLLLQSPWSLIADSSPTRVKEAWKRCRIGSMNLKEVETLHYSYLVNYKEAKRAYKQKTGKITGWIPDLDFLSKLQPPQQNLDNLELINKAIRRYLNPVLVEMTEQAEQKYSRSHELECNDDDNESNNKKFEILKNIIKSTAHDFISETIKKNRIKWEKDASKLLAWELYAEGLGQREIAKRCGHKQGWVSKLIQEKVLAENIAQEAALKLIRLNEFQRLRTDPQALDRTTQVLISVLISIEKEGDISLLKKIVKEAMDI